MGPFVGGWLVDAVSWRAVFLINLPLALAVVLVAVRHVPESRDPLAAPGLDVGGAALGALGLAAVTWALIEGDVAVGLGGAAGLVAFVARERRVGAPVVPLCMF